MKTTKIARLLSLLVLLTMLFPAGAAVADEVSAPPEPQAPTAPQARTAPIIIDHNSVNINAVPLEWIQAAKDNLHIAYGHTSHGSQLIDGMSGLVNFANGGGLGLSLPEDTFAWNEGGLDGALDIDDHAMGGDVGYYPAWVNNTHDYLGTPDSSGRGSNHPDVNVIIWSWCGQVNDLDHDTPQEIIDTYLAPMTALEEEYPGITFVYMTGHAEGEGETGIVHVNNQQIRNYAIANNKVLFDFYDIELYDPDGNYYGDKAVNDNCDYDSDDNGSLDANWATSWQGSHTENQDWYSCSCAHSQSLNCNQKAYAVWALWASIAGWNGANAAVTASKTASMETGTLGQTVVYTLTLASTAPITNSASINDAIPEGLTYVPGSLLASSGNANDSSAPALSWSGTLSPTNVVILTYEADIATSTAQVVTNTAVFEVEGSDSMTRTAAVEIMRPADYPDLTPSTKTASVTKADIGDEVTYTVVVRNGNGPLDATAWMSDTLPPGLAYVADSMSATEGTVNDDNAPELYWTGSLTPTGEITINYTAVVTYVSEGSNSGILPPRLINHAMISAVDQTVTRSVTITTIDFTIYLPLIMRNN